MDAHSVSMTASDIDPIVDIERAIFPVPWRQSAFLSEISKPYALNMVLKTRDALENERICAYSCNHIIGNELSILRLAVVSEKRRRGLGEQLMGLVLHQAMQRGATEAFLEVRASNKAAQMLYQKLGFRVVGTRPNYYPETGEHALVMTKTLKETS